MEAGFFTSSSMYVPVAYAKLDMKENVSDATQSARKAFLNADSVQVLSREVGGRAIFQLNKVGAQSRLVATSDIQEVTYDPKTGIMDITTCNSRYSLKPIVS